MADNYFYKMIKTLRHHEEVMLYGNILNIHENEIEETISLLKKEYQLESLDYPYTAPAYHEQAALWAAKTVYTTAQLMLYRENKVADLVYLLPDFSDSITPPTIVSADLCLRFLPNMLFQLKQIDSTDTLIPILENILEQWHYSGIDYPLKIEKLDFDIIISNKCLHQLYINRIITNKKIKLANHHACKQWVQASLGMFAQQFWNEFKTAISLDAQ